MLESCVLALATWSNHAVNPALHKHADRFITGPQMSTNCVALELRIKRSLCLAQLFMVSVTLQLTGPAAWKLGSPSFALIHLKHA